MYVYTSMANAELFVTVATLLSQRGYRRALGATDTPLGGDRAE